MHNIESIAAEPSDESLRAQLAESLALAARSNRHFSKFYLKKIKTAVQNEDFGTAIRLLDEFHDEAFQSEQTALLKVIMQLLNGDSDGANSTCEFALRNTQINRHIQEKLNKLFQTIPECSSPHAKRHQLRSGRFGKKRRHRHRKKKR